MQDVCICRSPAYANRTPPTFNSVSTGKSRALPGVALSPRQAKGTLSHSHSFGDETAIPAAFEDCLLALGLTKHSDPAVLSVAKRVVEFAKQVKSNPSRLRDQVLQSFKKEPPKQIHARIHRHNRYRTMYDKETDQFARPTGALEVTRPKPILTPV